MFGSGILVIPRPSRLSAHVHSRFRPPDIDLETVREILSRYGLDLVGAPRNLPNARRNRNLIVNTSAGKRVLKLYRHDWGTPTIAYEHSLLRRLAELHCPAPRLANTPDGTTHVELNGRNYCLFEFIDGINCSTSLLLRSQRLALMVTAGRTLARLHRQLREFLPEGRHHLGFRSYEGKRHRDMAWHVEKVAELKGRSRGLTEPREIELAGWLAAHSDQLLDELARLDETLSGSPLPRAIIHGDYGLHNLIFHSPTRATPVDFELARLEWRLTDLVSVVSKFRYRGGSYDFESIRHFLQGYGAEHPISDSEWQLFPLVWKHHKLAKAVQYWGSYFETGGPLRKLVSARDEVDQAPWALSNTVETSMLRAGL